MIDVNIYIRRKIKFHFEKHFFMIFYVIFVNYTHSIRYREFLLEINKLQELLISYFVLNNTEKIHKSLIILFHIKNIIFQKNVSLF